MPECNNGAYGDVLYEVATRLVASILSSSNVTACSDTTDFANQSTVIDVYKTTLYRYHAPDPDKPQFILTCKYSYDIGCEPGVEYSVSISIKDYREGTSGDFYGKIIYKNYCEISNCGELIDCPNGMTRNIAGYCEPLPGWEWSDEIGGYIPIVSLPILPPGIGHPPTYPPIPVEPPPEPPTFLCPPCYLYDAVLHLCVYDPLAVGCEDLIIDCVPVGGCVIPESVVLVPEDLDKILPPGYLESGSLPTKFTGKPLDSIFEPIEPTYNPDTGDCDILSDC